MEQENKENGSQIQQKIAMRVSGVSITVNLVLSLFKLLAGILKDHLYLIITWL